MLRGYSDLLKIARDGAAAIIVAVGSIEDRKFAPPLQKRIRNILPMLRTATGL